jgi:hypothetical protein
MNKEKKTYIEGIYNYCDRWCEKCCFTSNCYLFTTESRIASHQILNNGELPKAEDIFPRLEDTDENEDNFFFEEDEEEDFSQSDGFSDFSEDDFIPEEDEEKEEEDRKFYKTDRTPLEQLGYDYFFKAHALIKKLDEKYPALRASKETITDDTLKKLYDNFEIFTWYHALIYVKLKRALHGKIDIINEDDEEMKEIHAYDMNGTAKIATISIDNSLKALNELYSILPEEFNKEVSELLIILGKLKNLAENEFPDCMKFKRPGLDK